MLVEPRPVGRAQHAPKPVEAVEGMLAPPLSPFCHGTPCAYVRSERAPTYRLLERHFLAYTRVHEERFEARHGALRSVVGRSVNQYLECGRLMGGFARIQCPTCHDEHLLAFSCRTRNLCASCQSKRSAIFAERL